MRSGYGGSMPRRPTAPAEMHLRPRSAALLSIGVWVLCALLFAEAALRGEAAGWRTLPAVLLICALVWALLWAPRVVLHADRVEVRNVLVTHELPLLSISAVRLGAMLRFDVLTAGHRMRTVTAWNAPALGRDKPWSRLSSVHEDRLRGVGTPRPGPAERLARDQAASPSAVVRERWEEAMDAHAGEELPLPGATWHPNTAVLAVLGALVLAVVVNALV